MSAHAKFVHLRVHSAFSLLEGAMQPDEIAALCKKNRMPAVGITDTNNLFGLWDLTDSIVKAGVQMIVGCQFSLPLEPEKRTGPVPVAQQLGSIAVLVQSEKGYANLMKLASKAHLEVQVGEAPHISWEALAQYNGDLIVLTGGRKGILNRQIVNTQVDAAEAALLKLKEIFGDRLYVSRFLSIPDEGEVVVVDTASLDVVSRIALAYDACPDREDSGRGVPNQLSPLRISRDGTRAVVSGTKANTARGLFRDGQPLTFESRTRAFVAVIYLENGVELVDKRLDLNDREGPKGVAWSPFGDVIFVAARGNDVVDVFDVDTGRRVSQFAVGQTPVGVALDDDGHLAVANLLSRSVSLVDVSALVAGRANHAGVVVDVRTVAREPLDDVVLRGKRVFHFAGDRRMSKDGYIACASCHDDGGADGQTWDFTQSGEGLRNTISLRGRSGTGHGNVHWTANFDEIQDFEGDIRNAFSGTGLMSDDDFAATSDPLGAPKAGKSADLDALAAYVATFDRVPDSPWREDARGVVRDDVRRGRVVFLAADCQRCHGGPTFRDGLRHDVGTLGAGSGSGIGAALEGVGFDTPTLKGIFETAPYLHDGSAPTLDEALARHGEIPALSATEKADLVAYLLSLDEDSVVPGDDCGDECVAADVGEGEGEERGGEEGEGEEGEGEGDEGESCGSCAAGAGDVFVGVLALALRRRSRRT